MEPSAPVTPVVTPEPGTVRVRVAVAQTAEAVWAALFEPERLGMWFGDPDRAWQTGQAVRIDFGDGDFFLAIPSEIVAGRSLAFAWRFLGVGPLEQITWTVGAAPDGAVVEVTDADPARTAAEADPLVEGWTDFLQRLARHLATGERSRYAWRGDIDGSVDLPDLPDQPDKGGFAPLDPETLYRWLPVASDGFQPRWFFIVDEEGPRRFRVDQWNARRPGELTFTVEIPDAGPTWCTVAVEARSGGGARLRFAHTGWRLPGMPDTRGLVLRRRFARTWSAALRQVKELASSVSS